MKFTLSWLKDFVEIDASLDEISDKLCDINLEVESITDKAKELDAFEVAYIKEAEKHPKADKLQVCKVETKSGMQQIVCGAPNARAGIKVVLAPVGTVIPNGNFKIKKASIRDVESSGMLCAADELLIGEDSKGIIELDEKAKVGDKIGKYLGLNDPVIEIAITPNRGDALGVYGIARELVAAGLARWKKYDFPEIKYDKGNIIEDSKGCEAFFEIEMKNVKNCQSPDWLKSRLQNIGLSPISALVDITNYICFTFGRPMHVYDKDKLSGTLKVTRAKDGEDFKALSDKEYKLSKDDLVVRDDKNIQALAGVIGGALSACEDNTTNILLEAAYFDKDLVTNSGRNHSIETDSRYRFERYTDIQMIVPASTIAANMVKEICGGEVVKASLSGSVDFKPNEVSIDEATIERLTSLKIGIKDCSKILESLGFTISVSGSSLKAKNPSWRHDISIKEDLIEEIVRIHGFDKIPSVPMEDHVRFRLAPSLTNMSNIARRTMAAKGFDEVITFSFMNSKFAEKFSNLEDKLYLQNPISAELDYMRPSILPNLMDALAKNQARSIKDMNFFEVGPVFRGIKPDEEDIVVSAVMSGKFGSELHKESRAADIYDIKNVLGNLLTELGSSIDNMQLKTDNLPTYMHPTRSAGIYLGKNLLGHFGEIHPAIQKSADIDDRVIFFELNLSKLPTPRQKLGKRGEYQVSSYQPNVRDFAFLFDKTSAVGEVTKYIKSLDKNLIQSAETFDIYKGDKIDSSKKSVAIRVVIQAIDHTLSEDELSNLHKKIIDSVESKYSAKIRD